MLLTMYIYTETSAKGLRCFPPLDKYPDSKSTMMMGLYHGNGTTPMVLPKMGNKRPTTHNLCKKTKTHDQQQKQQTTSRANDRWPRHMTNDHQPPTTNHQSPITNHQSPTTHHQPQTTNNLWSMTKHLWLLTKDQPEMIYNQQPAKTFNDGSYRYIQTDTIFQGVCGFDWDWKACLQ